MYHCHLQIYLCGQQPQLWQTVQAMAPLPAFTHTFSISDAPDAALAAAADVVFAAPEGPEVSDAIRTLCQARRGSCQLILLLGRAQADALCTEQLAAADDLWLLPMPEKELRFRLQRWQQARQRQADAWQTSQYLETTINSFPSLIWYKTKDGIHEKVNDSFCHTVNKTKEQVQGRGHAYIWDVEQDDPACIESEKEVTRSGRTCINEETISTGRGLRLLTTYKSPLYDLDGSVMGTVGVGVDITQEHAYRQALQQKTQTLERLFTTMECGVMCHSVDGTRILSINQAALHILGYENQQQLLDAGFDMVADSVVEEDKPLLRQAIRSLTTEGDSVNIEYRVQHADGKLLHVMGNVKLVREDGELFYQRFLLDVTAQKLASERRQSELLQALTMDYDLVCYFDLDTGVCAPLQTSTDHADAIFAAGRQLEDCIAAYAAAYVQEADRDALLEKICCPRLKQELADEDALCVNYRIHDGEDTTYYQLKVVRTGDWQETRGIVLGLRSVDAETRAEQVRTRALEDALAQAKRASRAKSVFLSNMSHDIRTPMNAIIGFTTLALTHLEHRERVEGYLQKIMSSGNHLLSLINDVLDMSRIESGKITLEEKPCSLPEILHGLRNIVQADVHSKQLELYMDAADVQDDDILCDRLRLNQVLLNLLSNAIKYTPAGGSVSMRVRQKPEAPTGCATYAFSVSDTGIGMSQEFLSQIFEPFERERNSTTSGIQGTGLGMAITKNIVDMMGGDIRVTSQQNVGTEFVVTLTFRLCEGERPPLTIPQLSGCRALVVDDDFNTCDSVSGMLQQMGLRAEWTLSGKEAVLRTRQSVMRRDTFSVYIIDWLLPDMNGIEVTRRIRQEAGDQTPIIVLTAYDWADIEDEALAAGVTAFCSKPLFTSELHSCLRDLLVESPAGEPAADSPAARRNGRILLVEDNELNQEIAAVILEEAGFATEIAGDGRQALEMLRTSAPGHFQLVLMDVQMPVMNGYEATRAIRALPDKQLATIPILAMTANAFEEDRQAAMECGMNGHIAKPIDIHKLLETLDTLLP